MTDRYRTLTKILVISDSHGEEEILLEILEKNAGLTDRVIYLGDGYRDMLGFRNKIPRLDLVAGNMDSFFSMPHDLPENKLILDIEGVKVLVAHGHQFRVHNTMTELIKEARKSKIRLALFGHTHNPYIEETEGITFFNPGAVKFGSYGIVTLDSGKVTSAGHFKVKSK